MLIVLWEVLQDLGKGCNHPTVATSPEVLLSAFGLMVWIYILAITEIETSLLVVHDGIAVFPVLIHLVEIALIASKEIHLCHDRHNHIKRISPPPVIVCLATFLIAHNFLWAMDIPRIETLLCEGIVVEVDVCLEAYLPVAEKHILRPFAIVLVFPLGRVDFRSSLEEITLSPLLGVFTPSVGCLTFLLVSTLIEKEIRLHIARMIDSRVPESTVTICRMTFLPAIIDICNDSLHLLRLPGFGRRATPSQKHYSYHQYGLSHTFYRSVSEWF